MSILNMYIYVYMCRVYAARSQYLCARAYIPALKSLLCDEEDYYKKTIPKELLKNAKRIGSFSGG